MIEAGGRELSEATFGDSLKEIVVSVYLAMEMQRLYDLGLLPSVLDQFSKK
jgi:hypothetical protein